MSFLNRNNSSTSEDEFKEKFGMTREEFDAKLAEGNEAKAKVGELETKFGEQSSALDTLRNELEALRNPSPTPSAKQPTNFFIDPDQAFSERMAPLAIEQMKMASSLEEMKARQKYDREFKRWGPEIEEIVGGDAQLAGRTNPKFWENAVNIVKGRHAAELEESAAKGQFFFTEQGSGTGVGGGVDDTTFGLSREQLASAKRMNMTPKDFKEALDYSMSNYGHNAKGMISNVN